MSLINLSSRPKTKKDKQVSLERPTKEKKCPNSIKSTTCGNPDYLTLSAVR